MKALNDALSRATIGGSALGLAALVVVGFGLARGWFDDFFEPANALPANFSNVIGQVETNRLNNLAQDAKLEDIQDSIGGLERELVYQSALLGGLYSAVTGKEPPPRPELHGRRR